MNLEWDVKAPMAQCTACERPFEDKEACYSLLRRTEEEGYVRADYCLPCWEAQPPSGLFSAWKTVYRKPAPPPEDPLKKETAESLLRNLMETDDLEKRPVIFVLAVMLERRRLLVERNAQRQEDGSVTRYYEHKVTGETFVISDPQLRLDDLTQVQQDVMALLGLKAVTPGEGGEPAAPEPSSTASEPPPAADAPGEGAA